MPFDARYFDDIYRRNDDPWGLHSHFYEARKRAILLASLPASRYCNAFEPACATGALTAELAKRCDALLASDMNATAVERTRERLAGQSHVTLQQLTMPEQWPDQQFELIVVSEFLYYLSMKQLDDLTARLRSSLTAAGTIVACHWKRPIAPSIPTGDRLHALVAGKLNLHRLAHHDEADFVLDVWSTHNKSVAQREGLTS
jgi:SAM-dependent methyltransferase